MTVLSFINLKGGVAKTVSAINTAYLLAAVEKKKVLLIDNDKQGNATKFFGLHDYDRPSIADLLTVKGMDASTVIRHTAYENLDLIPSNMSLLKANKEVLMDCSRPQQTRLERALQGVWEQYDYCVIDNPPDINMSVINALAITNDVIVPVKIDKFAFDGLDELLEQLEDAREFNPRLTFAGCLITMYYPSDVCMQGREWLSEAGEIPFVPHPHPPHGKSGSKYLCRPAVSVFPLVRRVQRLCVLCVRIPAKQKCAKFEHIFEGTGRGRPVWRSLT